MKKNILKSALLLTILSLSIFSCNSDKSDDKIVKVSLRQEWFPNANYAGELFAMYETDKNNGIDIEVAAGSDNIDPIKLVLSGENQFGVASADRILTANEQGADLVVIGVANVNSPTCYLSKIEKNILSPKDFEGHTVGILTGTNTELIYKILKSKNQLDSKKIKEVEAPFDIVTFVSNRYDVRPAFVYDEPVSLEQQNIKYNIIKPEDYGVNFLGTVYFTKRSLVKENPELIQKFINSLIEGWKKAFENPEKGIKLLKQFDKNINENRELLSLRKALPYFKGDNNQILVCNTQRWNDLTASLTELQLVKNVDISKIIDNSFVEEYYKNKK